MNLLPDADQLLYDDVFNDIHDTFSRKIIVYKTPERIIISTNSNYNFIYTNNQDGLEVQYIPVSGTLDARIKWLDPSDLKGQKDIKEEIHGNIVRLKIKKEDIGWFDDWKRVEVDGRPVQFFGTAQPHGLFDPNFYTIYLEESN
jgi:hypothetical protein